MCCYIGKSNIVSALKTAQLALKNRVNKNQRQRIILFVGSPISASTEQLIKIGKQLKKNNVAVDVVNFGAENAVNDNAEKLEALISAVNSADNSHLVNIPPGPHVLSDLVGTSAIVLDADQISAGGGGGAGMGGNDMGIDESDPEMAMAIRMSMEEARVRDGEAANTTAPSATTTTPANATTTAAADDADMNDEEAMLAQAIALSMQNQESDDNTTTDTAMNNTNTTTATRNDDNTVSEEEANAALDDPDFINSLLSSVPGVNQTDINVNNLLDEMNKNKKPDDKQSDNKDNQNK